MSNKFCLSLLFLFTISSIFGQAKYDPKSNDIQLHFPLETVNDVVITNQYTSRGITHIYFQQAIDGIPIWDSRGAIHRKGNDKPYINNRLLKNIEKLNVIKASGLNQIEAVVAVALRKNYDTSGSISATAEGHKVKAQKISLTDIPVKKIYYLKDETTLVRGYQMTIEQVTDGFIYMYIVNAESGEIFKTISLTLECDFGESTTHTHDSSCNHVLNENVSQYATMMTDSSYNVFAWPVESPNFGVREIEVKPWLDNVLSSPDGWHDINGTTYTATRGNNVDAYIDDDNTNSPTNGDAARADGGADLIFDFPLDVSGNPTAYKEAAVTNLFYWNNVIHDMMHNYGFDEASGNFQETNYSGNGQASDYVRAEAQDGSGTCNANMGTPGDGSNPRMQMYLCNGRDGDFDNGVVVHEYGHGISTRLTGGASSPGCLNNQEQMGEGWSDFFGMMMTIENGDTGPDSRGMGTWLFGEGPGGDGIRPYPYSTDMNINPMTYATITSVSVPHGVGSVWATMLWDMTWLFIDEYGFDADIYNGTGGNNKAMEIVIEGLKLQPCSPGFVDGRDAILQADEMINGGVNKCMIWKAFANRGLGFSAVQGSTSSRGDGTEAFDLPDLCSVGLQKTADVMSGEPGDQIVYTLTALNGTEDIVTDLLISDDLPFKTLFVSATDGGVFLDDTISWPLFDLLPTESKTVTFTVQIDPMEDGYVDDIIDDLESGSGNWTLSSIPSSSTSWVLQGTETNSGNFAFFANDGSSPGIANITLASKVGLADNSFLTFYHKYDTETTYDGGLVEISIDGGKSWIDLGNDMTTGGYNSTVNGSNGRSGYSGNSNGWIHTIINLAAYSGNLIDIRFQMTCDQLEGGEGWWIDDITLSNLEDRIPNIAELTYDNNINIGVLGNPTLINSPSTVLRAEIETTDVSCMGQGMATATPSGGSGMYTYLWSTGATISTITGLVGGNYTVTISDGTQDIAKVCTILDFGNMSIAATAISITGYGSADGSASVSVTGGASPFSYNWSNGGTTPTIGNLAGGIYTVTVSDGGNCSLTDSVFVGDPDNCSFASYEFSLTFDQYPGETSYRLTRDGDGKIFTEEGDFGGAVTGSTITRFFCLPEGCYTLEVLDSYGDGICGANSDPLGEYTVTLISDNSIVGTGCFTQFSGSIAFCSDGPVLYVTADVTDVSCNGTNDGEVSAQGQSGSGSYTYSWNTGATTATIQNLIAGIYRVTVSDGANTSIRSYEVLDAKYSMVSTTDDNIIESLRDVLNNGCSSDTVLFAPNLINDPIILTSGEILISDTKVIRGLGIDMITLDAMINSRIFQISNTGNLTIENLTIQNGFSDGGGGNILNNGTLILSNMNMNGGQDKDDGPRSISNTGTLTIKENVQFND